MHLEGATHEVMVYALDPDWSARLDECPRWLTPVNYVGQFVEVSDAAAEARVETAVRDILAGALSPDTDYIQHWIARFGASNVKVQMKTSQEIHDMIQCFPLDATESPELTASRLLDILTAMNERMDAIERESTRCANVASCLANGIRPD